MLPFLDPIKSVVSIITGVVDYCFKLSDRHSTRRQEKFKQYIEPLFADTTKIVDDLLSFVTELNAVFFKLYKSNVETEKRRIELKEYVEQCKKLRLKFVTLRIDVLRRTTEIKNSQLFSGEEKSAIDAMMTAIIYIIQGIEGNRSSRPQSFVDAVVMIAETPEGDEVPTWVQEKVGSPYLTRTLKQCELAWADICSLHEQLRIYFASGFRPEGGYKQMQLMGWF
jgi:hypothetical protein